MEVGHRYRVTFKDCGLEGEFTAIFMGWGRYDWDDYEADEPSLTTGLSIYDDPEFSLWDNGLLLGPVQAAGRSPISAANPVDP